MDKSIRVLVIDDSVDDRTLCERTLKRVWSERLRIIEAGSGDSGLEAIEAHAPHCVLLDYSLPGRNGIEVLKLIRAQHPFLPVIMLTGQGNETVAVQSMKEGAQDYISKSTITPETLGRIVVGAIEHNALEKRVHDQRTALEIFTRALAHDLKEPVRTIRSFLDLITDWTALNEKSQRSFEFIRKAADRMDALIDSVYFYTRLDSTESMATETCDLNRVLADAKDNLVQLVNERGAVITSDPLPTVEAHRVHLTQLFQNLLSNAIRHCDKAARIHVGAQEKDDHWQISVQDNGPGVASEHLEMIFAPFKRLSHDRGARSGLGLGLAINRKIVESHDGRIWCESTPGSGACFYFSLPRADIKDAQSGSSNVTAPAADGKAPENGHVTARVLMVDDNEADLVLNRIMLIDTVHLRCDVLTARDGGEALTCLNQAASEGNPVDLVLLDINMPRMNGFELLAQMRDDPSVGTTVVMCSTSSDETDKRKAASLGAAGYMTKPPDFSRLKAIIGQNPRLRLDNDGKGLVLVRTAPSSPSGEVCP